MLDSHALMLLVVVIAGCPGPSATPDAAKKDATADGPACVAASETVNGTLIGATLAARDAVYVPPAGGGSAFLAITDFAGTCAVVQANANKANSNVLVFTFTSGPPTVGTINSFDVQYAQYDATCSSSVGESGTGTMTVTRADNCAVTATYDVTLNTDHVTGSFTAPTCAYTPSGTTTCQ